jgi:hypothetical protein
MRKASTGTKDFRENLDEIAELMAYEVCRDLPTKPVEIETPMLNVLDLSFQRKLLLFRFCVQALDCWMESEDWFRRLRSDSLVCTEMKRRWNRMNILLSSLQEWMTQSL